MDVLYIVIPAYNEQSNIKELIDEWYPVIEKHNGDGASRIVIVNDGSKDATADIISKEAETKPLLKLINKPNGGHGPAIMTGYRYAIKNKADYIFQTDSDRQTLPSEFEGFWIQRTRFDAIIGRRYLRQDGLSRILVTKALKLIFASIFRRRIDDANSPYRLMKREALRDAISYIENCEPLPNIMIAAVFARERRRVLYKDITFRQRQGGVNSINLAKISRIGLDAIVRFRRLNKKFL